MVGRNPSVSHFSIATRANGPISATRAKSEAQACIACASLVRPAPWQAAKYWAALKTTSPEGDQLEARRTGLRFRGLSHGPMNSLGLSETRLARMRVVSTSAPELSAATHQNEPASTSRDHASWLKFRS